jgi:hypothetical protein
MKQVSYPKPAIVRPCHAQFSCLDDLALGICEPLAGRSPAEIVGSNPTGGMDICLL